MLLVFQMFFFSESEAAVINSLIEQRELSKAQIASTTSLSKPTVLKVITSLLSKKTILERSSGNRLLYRLNRKFNSVLSIEISATKIRFAIYDFNLYLQSSAELKKYTLSDRCKFLDKLCFDVLLFVAKSGAEDQDFIISVATAGVVDTTSGQIIKGTANFPDWQNFNLAKEMSTRLFRPVIIENNVRSSLIGECYLKRFNINNNVSLICLDAGVGSAMLCSGRILRGSDNRAGEIGFMMTSRESLSKQWIQRGALEDKCSLAAIKEKYLIVTENDLNSDNIFSLIGAGDLQGELLFNEFIDYLSIAVINITSIINPERIIFYGETCKHHSQFLPRVRKILELHQVDVELEVSENPDTIATLGAAILGFKMKYPRLKYINAEV